MEWQNTTDESGETYRYLVPNVILADLWHFQDSEWGDPEMWRLCLARLVRGDILDTADHELAEPMSESAAKAWAEPLIDAFLEA